MRRAARWVLPLLFAAATLAPAADEEIVLGSKKFTEGAVLGEIAAGALRSAGFAVHHRIRLGGTTVCFNALETGEIDVYADYTGTLTRELLSDLRLEGYDELREALAGRGITITRPLGFDNTYAIAVRRATAEELELRNVSDLVRHRELQFGFGPEFMARADCWPGLKERYGFRSKEPLSINHELSYHALASGDVDAIDVYTTDAKIPLHDIVVLEDDRRFFPEYEAVYLYRAELERSHPGAERALRGLEGRIEAETIRRLNSAVEVEGLTEAEAAARFLAAHLGITAEVERSGLFARLGRRTREHLFLVTVSLALGTLVGVPLGWFCARRPRRGQVVLGVVGVIQTIPSLALLVLMIPLLGIDAPPAIAALFLYSLLPIVRGTCTGLVNLPPDTIESAVAIGLPPLARLRHVELPLAAPSILSGIKTAAIINIGFATLGAFIGAGGYGAPILTGIDLNDMSMILEGAIPAAALALVAQVLFELVERGVVPKGLRLASVTE